MISCPKCKCRIGPTDIKFCPNGCGEIGLINEMRKVLQGIIDSCVHPDIAVRCLMVDLKPIREILKKNEIL